MLTSMAAHLPADVRIDTHSMQSGGVVVHIGPELTLHIQSGMSPHQEAAVWTRLRDACEEARRETLGMERVSSDA